MKNLFLSLVGVSLALTLASCAESNGTDQGTGGSGDTTGTGTGGATGTAGRTGTGTGGAAATGAGGSAVTGTAGTTGTGTAGTTGSGTAGTTGSGTAGTTGTGGGGGKAGGAGGASAGTNGSAGRGGTTGTAGTTGAGGGGHAGTGAAGTNGAGGGGRGGSGTAGTGSAGTGVAGTSGAAGAQGSLPPGVTALFPPPGGQGICPDPPLRITFSGAPTLGTAGKIQVFNSSGTAVASVDMSATTVTDTIGGTAFILLNPVYVDGNAAVIYLKTKALSYGQTYYVTVDSGAIKPPGGGTLSITGNTAWKFTTASAAPSNLSALTVALDGSGPFCTVQGATDALPANNTAASTITIKTGIYHEIMHVKSKSNITLTGQDRTATVIEGTNNNTQQNLNDPTAMTASTSNRSLLGFDSTNGLTISNLTIHNLTPQNGSQAEALRLQNCDKCTISNANVESLQDTLLWSGRVYANNCYIAGNVDYVWGTGVAYFNACEIHTVGRSGVLVQSRNLAGAYGYVFVDSKLTADSAATNNMLARIDEGDFPGSQVAYINCQMTNIAAAGWTVTDPTATLSVRFWEYMSTDASGNAISTSGRQFGTQISASQATMLRDPTVVLNGWQP